MATYSNYQKRTSNTTNHVNYDIAYLGNDSLKPGNPSVQRYFVTIATESMTPQGAPRVHAAHTPGYVVQNLGAHIISRNLYYGDAGMFLLGEYAAHNSGFLRDQWGYLVPMSGQAGGTPYYWVYYGTDINLLYSNPGAVDINRTPFDFNAP